MRPAFSAAPGSHVFVMGPGASDDEVRNIMQMVAE